MHWRALSNATNLQSCSSDVTFFVSPAEAGIWGEIEFLRHKTEMITLFYVVSLVKLR